MAELTRRDLLRAAGLAAGGAALGACSTAPSGGKGNKSSDVLQWWDHFNPLRDLNKEVFAQFQKDTGTRVEYTYYQTAKLGQALQLARQSNQLPDVHSNVGLQLPLPALIKDKWYQPMRLTEEALGRLPKDALVDGLHVFDDKVYSFPIFNTRQYWNAVWFNKELVAKAGLDPANPPRTYDEFRAAARAVRQKGGGKAYGWIIGLGQPPRLEEQVTFLAQSAGSRTLRGGFDFTTGEAAFHTEPYLTVFELFAALKKDGVVVPGANAMNDKVARARWATGLCGYYFDGPWCPGVVSQDLKQFADKMDVGPGLVPNAGDQVTAYRGPQGGAFWLSGFSDQQETASQLLGRLTEPDYYVGLAENMDQPPLDLSAIDKADVHPTYKKVVGFYQKDAFIAPVPVPKNLDVAKAQAEQKDVKPGLGEIVQGFFSGDVTDVKKALKQLSDKTMANRDQAIVKATKAGAKVDASDWAFANWQPRKDYTADMYDGA